ncbi:hypothetical protein ORI89_05430 [Sphingobacterium sp. UT-1RO-CII-1]|uniref:hypothetical protein n=1 Tax=Sphingobacterium sp. UT-1RO-CII-1 TaxID=2995225 RepID=UPI00227B5A9F|nr:hypothetical protein [Sphingobacterium sp. UT-1RO-CII-1]MCY4779081.1 hypothetical protein [Sphingobacterium sp. UT-1RO-CII-1]
MLTENDITNIRVAHLELNGYTNINGLTTNQRGIDITALNSLGNHVCIEVKGETSSKVGTKRHGLPFTGNQIASHVSGALLQTINTMNKPKYKNYEFCMAFPMNHEILIQKNLPSLNTLNIKIYLVSLKKVIVL